MQKQIKLTDDQQAQAQNFDNEARQSIKTAYENLINIIKSQPLNQNCLLWNNAVSRLDEFYYWTQICPIDTQKLIAHLGIDINADERPADEVAVHDGSVQNEETAENTAENPQT